MTKGHLSRSDGSSFFVDQGPFNQTENTGRWRTWGENRTKSQEHRNVGSLQVKGRKKMDAPSSSKAQYQAAKG